MTTTNSNGIVFLEETDPISPFHTLINTLQQGTSNALDSKTSFITSGWTNYNPVWASTGAAPSLGTGGGIAGAYKALGRTVNYRIHMFIGTSGAAGGSGAWRWTLPFASDPNSYHAVTGHLVNGSVSLGLTGVIGPNANYIEDVVTGPGARLIAGFTLTAGARMVFTGSYQAAP